MVGQGLDEKVNMHEKHLDHLLEAVAVLQKNTWGEGYTEGIHNNWIRAARKSGRKFEIERKNNHPYIKFFRKDSSYIGEIDPWKLPATPLSSSRICASKIQTQYFLENAGVSTPWSVLFEKGEMEKARDEAFKRDKEVVVKAHNLSQAIGVFLHVDEAGFEKTFEECVRIQENRKRNPRVIVQELMHGFELRCTVIEGELVNVLARIPAYVIGDGSSTILQLIEEKNERRESDRFLRKRRIKPEEMNLQAKLKADGRSLDMVPDVGQSILLSSISNVGHGGETANLTDLVSDEIKETATAAVRAIPGLTTGGVDVMAETLDTSNPRVIEVNSFPHAFLSIYPTYGESVNPLDMYLRSWLSRDDFENGVWKNWDQSDLDKLARYYDFYNSKIHILKRLPE